MDRKWNSVAKNDDKFSNLQKVWEIKFKKIYQTILIFPSKISILGMESCMDFNIWEVHEVLLVFHFIFKIMETIIVESHGLSICDYLGNQFKYLS